MYKREEGRKSRVITEPCKFSLPEVRGDSLEMVGRMGRLGPSGQVVPGTGIVCGNQRLDTCMHAHTNEQLVSKEVGKEGQAFPSGFSTYMKTFSPVFGD